MNTFTLTFTQCKQIISNGVDLRDLLERLNGQPDFMQDMGIESIADIKAVNQGGCESGACMPAVTYYQALECLKEHEESLNEFTQDMGDITFNFSTETLGMLAVKVVSYAVESFCRSFEHNLDSVDWD